MKQNKRKTTKKLCFGIFSVIVMTLSLGITTYAYMLATVKVEENFFQTGEIKITMSDIKTVGAVDESLYEPGMTVEKDFSIKNESTWDVYYKIYFTDIQGELADVLETTIKTGEKVLYEGKLSELTRETVGSADDILAKDEERQFKIIFHFPEEEGNDHQDKDLSFKICADAVQTKNNENKVFE